MRNSPKVVAFSVLSVIFSAGLHAETHQHGEMSTASDTSAQRIIRGTGAVKNVDLSSKKIMISHEAIPVVGWPAMTMRFTFMNINGSTMVLKAGTRVDFTFVQQGNISLFKSVNDTQSWSTIRSECSPCVC